MKEYAADGDAVLRSKYTDYNLGEPYLLRRIIGLVSAIHVTDAEGWQGKVTYGYDLTGLQSLPAAATQHDANYSASFTADGNVTSVSRWDVTEASRSRRFCMGCS